MKPLLFCLFSFISVLSSAQTAKDIFNPAVPLVWLGCDFSHVRFTTRNEFINQDQIGRFFVDCNNIVFDAVGYEQVEHRLKREVTKDFSYVTALNATVDWHQAYSDDVSYTLKNDTIQSILASLQIDRQKYKDHIGLVFCEENYCKTQKTALIAVVFFAVNDLKPLKIKHVGYAPKGYGFMYYWSYPNRQAMWYLRKIERELK